MALPISPSELSRARPGTWPVWKDYRIVDGYLRPVPGAPVRHYQPQDQPDIPFEIAKLAVGDEADMVRFARQWGLLGHHERWLYRQYESWFHTPGRLREPDELVDGPGDPVDWVQVHARELARCISLVDGLARGDQQGLLKTMRSYYSGDLISEPLGWDMSTLSDRARSALSFAVSTEIERVRPELRDDGTIGFKYTSMVEIAYVHVARLSGERSQIGRCEECGAFFEKVHGHQRFCPPERFGADKSSESRCSYRQRYRRLKAGRLPPRSA